MKTKLFAPVVGALIVSACMAFAVWVYTFKTTELEGCVALPDGAIAIPFEYSAQHLYNEGEVLANLAKSRAKGLTLQVLWHRGSLLNAQSPLSVANGFLRQVGKRYNVAFPEVEEIELSTPCYGLFMDELVFVVSGKAADKSPDALLAGAPIGGNSAKPVTQVVAKPLDVGVAKAQPKPAPKPSPKPLVAVKETLPASSRGDSVLRNCPAGLGDATMRLLPIKHTQANVSHIARLLEEDLALKASFLGDRSLLTIYTFVNRKASDKGAFGRYPTPERYAEAVRAQVLGGFKQKPLPTIDGIHFKSGLCGDSNRYTLGFVIALENPLKEGGL